jgi:transcriptional regulator with GAF, ATPase, and Fis domain
MYKKDLEIDIELASRFGPGRNENGRDFQPSRYFFICNPIESKRVDEAIRQRDRLLQINIDERKRVEEALKESEARSLQNEEALKQALLEIGRLKEQLQAENVYLREEVRLAYGFGEIIGQGATFAMALHQAEQVAPTDTSVLLTGETGTGKELLAHAIHNLSSRKDRPLVKVNCAALPASLVESELFGHEKGAFTGAGTARSGRFKLADGATIFLDEIGELPLELQAKLLRVLQEGEFERLGSSKTIKVDVRVIAASNRDLEQEVKRGTFRPDLFYRLNVFPIRMPSLRERREDIGMLVKFFVEQISSKMGKRIEEVPEEMQGAMEQYGWPGNVRELKNVIERAVILTQGGTLQLPEELKLWMHNEPAIEERQEPETAAAPVELDEVQRRHIMRVLKQTFWRIEGAKGAAAILGINPGTLRSRMKRLGICRPVVNE